MNEIKKISIPVVIVVLSAAFLLVSFIVYLYGGKSAKWVARKMKLGAAIIAIGGITTGCPVVTCYDPAPSDWFRFDNIDSTSYLVVADLPNDSILTGNVTAPTCSRYIFEIETLDSQLVDSGYIEPLEGSFDRSNGDFTMDINSALDTGFYQIAIYLPGMVNDEKQNFLLFRTELAIK
jgi:hypothetical protein